MNFTSWHTWIVIIGVLVGLRVVAKLIMFREKKDKPYRKGISRQEFNARMRNLKDDEKK
jgi:hypothetical protein